MESISICIFSTKLGKRKIENVVSAAGRRILFIGLGGEIPRRMGKLASLPHISSASSELQLGFSGLDFPSKDIMNSHQFCWMVRALKAETDLALIMHVFPGSSPNSPFGSCKRQRSITQSAFSKGLCPAARGRAGGGGG